LRAERGPFGVGINAFKPESAGQNDLATPPERQQREGGPAAFARDAGLASALARQHHRNCNQPGKSSWTKPKELAKSVRWPG
jgi:hypothetical protein